MTKQKRAILLSLLLALALVAALLVAFIPSGSQKTEEHELTVKLTAEETSEVVIADESGSDFALLFSSDIIQGDQELAKTLETTIRNLYGIRVRPISDVAAKEVEKEILIGNTKRAQSAELYNAVLSTVVLEEDFAWGYAYIDGKLLFAANNALAYQIGGKEFVDYLTDNNFTVPSDLCTFGYKTRAEYDAELKAIEDQKKEEYLKLLVEMNAEFTDSQFNTDKFAGVFYKPMIAEDGSGYYASTKSGKPWMYPTDDQHPRYLLTEDNIATIKAMLEDGKNKNSEYYNVTQNFWKLADATEEEHHWGEFPTNIKNGNEYRWDGKILSIIEAKAMAYLVTGDEKYAYEALICIKNAVLTLHYTTDLHMDVYHGPSHVMVILAAVYDWCYDVMSEQDKWQLIWGTAQILGPQMEAGYRYPPSGFGPVNGHGTGPQLARDWMSVATVFYDEAPDWYEYVAGRWFNEFLPVANAQFENGWVSQGPACYAPIKVYVQMWAAYLIKTATGENFLNDDADKTMEYFISHITPRQTTQSYQQYYFQTGDGGRSVGGTQVAWAEYLLVSALYNNPVIFAQAKDVSRNFLNYNQDTIYTLGPAFQLCFISAVDYNGEGARDGIDTIQYFGYPASQMTAREEWGNPDSVAVLMRMLNLTMANHEGQDHGTFQIYYKGLLAATSGEYKKYGSPAHYYYQQATISSNGLLIFNPANADPEPIYNGNAISNVARYYYSGSQRKANIGTTDVDSWLNSESTMSETTGAAWGYNDDGSSKYAYLGGDLTLAYNSNTVDYVGRKMFTLFTGDENFPALFFTFDQVISDSEDFTKHWTLHTVKEPTIDQDNLTATIINGDGKMYLQNLYGADAIMKVGGSGYAWWINGYFTDPSNRGSWDVKTQSFLDETNKGSWVEGKNVIDEYAGEDAADKIWGRIELRTEGSKFSRFFNVMAVTDTVNETPFEIEKFVSEDGLVYGAKYEKSIVTFLSDENKTAEKRYKEFSFKTEGTGLYEYYIAGLEAGTWNVKVDGLSVAYSLSEADGELLTFTAPAGEVVVTPGSDVIGANGGKIKYVTGGALLPPDTLYIYKSETDFPLPTEVTRGSDVFVGWYTSQSYEPETKVEFIPAGTTGTFTVYAKWISNYVDEDYTETVINHQGSNVKYNGISYNGSGKAGSSFITKSDEDGVNYLEWLEGTQDPMILMNSSTKNFSTLGADDKCVSFTVKLSLNEGSTPMATHMRLIAKKDVNGGNISSTSTYLFTTDTAGNVKSHTGNLLETLSTDKVTNLRIVIDFKNGEMRYYDDDFNVIFADKFKAPAATLASNTEEFLKCLTEYIFYFYGSTSSNITDAALRVYGIRVQEGDEFKGLAKPQTEGIKYNGNGVKIPYTYPKDFNSDGSITLLPDGNDLYLDGHIFDGWYTTSTFDEGTRTTYVPAGYEGLYEIWAKWNRIFIDEDYSGVDIDHFESNKSYNGLSYNSSGKPSSSYKTETTEDGTKYLVFTPGAADPLIIATNTTNNISAMSDSAVSYTLTLSKNGAATIPSFEFRLIGKHTVNGETGKGDSNIYFGKINANGEFTLGSSTTVVTPIGDKPTTVRIVLDFADGTISAYDEWGNILASVSMPSIPSHSGATTYSEWKNCFQNYLFYMRRTGGNADKVNESVRIYGIRIEEGNAFELTGNEEPPKPNGIIYETNGGTLPEDAPAEYDVSVGTLLPTNVTKEGYIFAGWYTDEKLTERIDYIPFGTKNPVKVFAKWYRVAAQDNFDGFVVDASGANSGYGRVFGLGTPNAGTGIVSVLDENDNTYLKVSNAGSSNAFIYYSNASNNMTTLSETAVSWEFDMAKLADTPLASVSGTIPSSGGKQGTLSVFNMNGKTGELKLSGSNVVAATIGETKTTVRITVDFEAGTITAYDAEGNVLDSVIVKSVPTVKEGTQPASLAEWQKVSVSYLYYISITNSNSDKTVNASVAVDNIKIYDGRVFDIKFDTELPKSTSIKYETNGGVLASDAPTEYDPTIETVLPVPAKDGFAFAGWYTSESFDEATRVEKIAVGTDGMLTLYAKWTYAFVTEDFESKTDWSADKTTSYNKVNFNLQKEGTTAKTVTDEQWNTYVAVTVTADDGIMMVTNASYNLTHMSDTRLSIELDIIPPAEGNLSNLNINIATSGGAYGQLGLTSMSGKTGLVKLAGGTKTIADLTNGKATVRLLVDFGEGIVYAYDEVGNVIDSFKPAVPSGKNGAPATLAEWQKVATNYLFYGYMTNPYKSTEGATSSIGFDNVKITEGEAFYVAPATETDVEPEASSDDQEQISE